MATPEFGPSQEPVTPPEVRAIESFNIWLGGFWHITRFFDSTGKLPASVLYGANNVPRRTLDTGFNESYYKDLLFRHVHRIMQPALIGKAGLPPVLEFAQTNPTGTEQTASSVYYAARLPVGLGGTWLRYFHASWEHNPARPKQPNLTDYSVLTTDTFWREIHDNRGQFGEPRYYHPANPVFFTGLEAQSRPFIPRLTWADYTNN